MTKLSDLTDEARTKQRDDWLRRQAMPGPSATQLVPTLPERINRLSPFEKAELKRIISSLKLRKVIRRTLLEARWQADAEEAARLGTMKALREHVRAPSRFEPAPGAITFDLVEKSV